MTKNKIIESVNEYYTEKVKTHGTTPKGVDWNGTESQELRFKILLEIVQNPKQHFSMLDYGCGYGAMYQYMKTNFPDFLYTGFDISEAMIAEGKKIYPDKNVSWQSDEAILKPCDYVVASGIFNVRLGNNEEEWKKYILESIHKINDLSRIGFSCNFLTGYSDKEYMKDYLHYADPLYLFDYCKKNISKYVALLHNYPLYEFTLLINKTVV